MVERLEDVIVLVVQLVQARIVVRVLHVLESARRLQNELHARVVLQLVEHRFNVSDDFTFASKFPKIARLRDEIQVAEASR